MYCAARPFTQVLLRSFAELCRRAGLVGPTVVAEQDELARQAVIHFRELSPSEWQGLDTWSLFTPHERTRLIQSL